MNTQPNSLSSRPRDSAAFPYHASGAGPLLRSVRNNMHTLVLLLLGVALSMRALAADIPLTAEDSAAKEVDKLVLQLVSSRPAPHPNGYWGTTAAEEMAVPYMTSQVSNALVMLKALGPAIFPALVKHLRDDRYSFSDISGPWENFTVGDAVVEVLSDGDEMFSEYKARTSRWAVYLSFKSYHSVKDPEKWAERAKSKTRLEIQLDFLDWFFFKETKKKRGFVEEAQGKDIVDRYEGAWQEVRKQYSESSGP
jgi:uncharacterized protein YdeI (BOF family)